MAIVINFIVSTIIIVFIIIIIQTRIPCSLMPEVNADLRLVRRGFYPRGGGSGSLSFIFKRLFLQAFITMITIIVLNYSVLYSLA
jgi:hypothetical protein